MKNLMMTSAAALVLGTAAFAQTSPFSDMPFDAARNLKASDILGARVYASETDVDASTPLAANGEAEWDDIGEINELILTRDGAVQSVIVGVGGFLGLGEKDVAISMTQLKIVSDGDSPEDYFLVVTADAAALGDAPAYGQMNSAEATRDPAAAGATKTPAIAKDTAAVDTAVAPVEGAGQVAQTPMLTAPLVERDGYQTVTTEGLAANDLTGKRVYGANDEDVGEISELVMTEDGKLDRAVIDVGGFLGIGERSVAVTFDELQIMRDDAGDLRVYIDSSKAALEALPVHEG